MKKTVLLSIFCFYCLLNYAQNIDTPYTFPVRPGSEQWQSFKTTEEMYKACQVPDDILKRLTTNALLKTCLAYPASAVLLIHNTPQQGFEDWKQHFNGIAELLKRKEAGQEMLKLYLSFDTRGHAAFRETVDKGRYAFRLSTIEIILVQDEITGSLDELQQKSLLKACLDKYKALENDDVYGFSSRLSTGRIVAKLAAGLSSSEVKAQLAGNDVQEFIATGVLKDQQKLQDIIAAAAKITL